MFVNRDILYMQVSNDEERAVHTISRKLAIHAHTSSVFNLTRFVFEV